MSRTRTYTQVDVFTDRPLLGNPLAVVLDAEGLDDAAMQAFARWTNLSETTFLLPPTDPAADYRVRIFTPGGELPFAGHPTLGSCHAWLAAGGRPRQRGLVRQQCGVGLVSVRQDDTPGSAGRLFFAAPPLKRSAPSPTLLAQVAGALGLSAGQIVSAQLLDNGPVWLALRLDSVPTVLRLAPDHAKLKFLEQKVGVVGVNAGVVAIELGANPELPWCEVRAFAAPIGVPEDPVTGSLNAALAQWLIEDGVAPPRYVAAQGRCLQRDGRVFIERDDAGQVWVGGHSVTVLHGHATL